MLNTESRKKLKEKVSRVRALLLGGFTKDANGRFLLEMNDKVKRLTTLQKNDPAAFYVWQLLEKKLASSSQTLDAFLKERTYTWLNRIFFLFRFEALGLQPVKVLTGMKNSSGWREFHDFCPDLCNGDDQGFGFLVKQLCDLHAHELPGLFEDDACDREFGIPGLLLYQLIEIWNDNDMADIFSDDTSAGWLYQYFNDPDREAINEKVGQKGKISGDEIASATQLFTERYMVEWLLQNSLGNQWLAICQKNQWQTPSQTIIAALTAKRAAHNARIAIGEVTEDTPLTIDTGEEHWKYYLPRDLSEAEVASAPASIRDVRLLDPACGSGHFLIYAFELLFHFYEEENALAGRVTEPVEVAYAIIENNLFGVDLDPRAVQIAAASLYTTARRYGKRKLNRLNLVATRPALGGQNPATLENFVQTLAVEINLPEDACKAIVGALQSSAILGSLLQVRTEIHKALEKFGFFATDAATAETAIYEKLEKFLGTHDSGDDLGFYQMANQLSRGLRLLRILDEKYDVVCANPPYLSESKVAEELAGLFVSGASELYESFIYIYKERLKSGGFFALLTAHNFLFIDKFKELRDFILKNYTLDSLAQLGVWTFKDISQPGALGFACFVLRNFKIEKETVFLRIGSGNFRRDPYYKEPYLLNQPPDRLYLFAQSKFAEIEGSPMIYWWPDEFREWYLKADKVQTVGAINQGMASSNNARFVRLFAEVAIRTCSVQDHKKSKVTSDERIWFPYLKGAAGKRWFENLDTLINYKYDGLEVKQFANVVFTSWTGRIINRDRYFKQGIAYSYIGTDDFFCRLRKYRSIFDVSGSSIFVPNPEEVQVALSTKLIPYVSQSINPTINNQVGDIKHLPIPQVANWQSYYDRAKLLYDDHFARQETNIEYEYRGDA